LQNAKPIIRILQDLGAFQRPEGFTHTQVAVAELLTDIALQIKARYSVPANI